ELARRHGRDPFPSPQNLPGNTSHPAGRKTDPEVAAWVEPIDAGPAPVAVLVAPTSAAAAVAAPVAIPVVPLPPRPAPVPGPKRPLPPVVRLLINPAFWLIPAALLGVIVLFLAIHDRKKETPPPNRPPIQHSAPVVPDVPPDD